MTSAMLMLVGMTIYVIIFIVYIFKIDRIGSEQSKRKSNVDILIELMGEHLGLLEQELKLLESGKIDNEKLKSIRTESEKIRELIMIKLC